MPGPSLALMSEPACEFGGGRASYSMPEGEGGSWEPHTGTAPITPDVGPPGTLAGTGARVPQGWGKHLRNAGVGNKATEFAPPGWWAGLSWGGPRARSEGTPSCSQALEHFRTHTLCCSAFSERGLETLQSPHLLASWFTELWAAKEGRDEGVTGPAHASGWRHVGRGAGSSWSHRAH